MDTAAQTVRSHLSTAGAQRRNRHENYLFCDIDRCTASERVVSHSYSHDRPPYALRALPLLLSRCERMLWIDTTGAWQCVFCDTGVPYLTCLPMAVDATWLQPCVADWGLMLGFFPQSVCEPPRFFIDVMWVVARRDVAGHGCASTSGHRHTRERLHA